MNNGQKMSNADALAHCYIANKRIISKTINNVVSQKKKKSVQYFKKNNIDMSKSSF